MSQLDKIIKIMLDQGNADIVLATGSEPQLRVEGSTPHVLINRKLTAAHLRLLLSELAGDSMVPQLEANDGGEFTYTLGSQTVSVQVRGWTGNLEARVRPPVRRGPLQGGAAVARIELAKAPAAELRRAATSPAAEAQARGRSPEMPRRASSDGLELDLGGGPSAYSPSAPSDLELDLANPPSSSRGGPSAPSPRISEAPPATSLSRQIASAPVPVPAAPLPAPVPAVEMRGEPRSPPSTSSGEPPIHVLFRGMLKQNGSDLHVSTGERPMIRRDGDIVRLDDHPRFKGDQVMDLLRPIFPERNLEEFERDHDTDFAYEMPNVSRFRANVFLERRGVGAVFRTIPTEIATAEKLGLSAAIQNLCYLSKGLVLVTGPTGSGKSTTLSGLIDLINRTRHDHVVTIEDPIEFVHQSKSCLINQREVGPHTGSFKRALRAALREDPDVVMVGEMRDLETTAIALETAETGHLVFGTLHTSTAYSTIDRLIDSFPSDQQAQMRTMLSETLKGVISQTLCKKIGGGRIAVYEVLLVNSAVSNLIREGKTFQIPSIMQTARKTGMVLLNDALYDLVEKKKVEPREAYIKAIDKANFVNVLRAGGHKLDFLGGAAASTTASSGGGGGSGSGGGGT